MLDPKARLKELASRAEVHVDAKTPARRCVLSTKYVGLIPRMYPIQIREQVCLSNPLPSARASLGNHPIDSPSLVRRLHGCKSFSD